MTGNREMTVDSEHGEAGDLEEVAAAAVAAIPGVAAAYPHWHGRSLVRALAEAGYSIVRTADLERLRAARPAEWGVRYTISRRHEQPCPDEAEARAVAAEMQEDRPGWSAVAVWRDAARPSGPWHEAPGQGASAPPGRAEGPRVSND